MVRIWLSRGAVAGISLGWQKECRSGANTLSVWMVLVTVLGMALPRRIFAEGNAHLGAQDPGLGGLGGDAVELRNLAHEAVVDDLRVE